MKTQVESCRVYLLKKKNAISYITSDYVLIFRMASPLAPMSQALQDPSSLALAGWELTSPRRSPISGSVSHPLGPGGDISGPWITHSRVTQGQGWPRRWSPELVSDHRAHCSDLYAEILVTTSLNYCDDHWFWKWEGERSGTVLRYMVSDCLGTASGFCSLLLQCHVHPCPHTKASPGHVHTSPWDLIPGVGGAWDSAFLMGSWVLCLGSDCLATGPSRRKEPVHGTGLRAQRVDPMKCVLS